jgi:ribosomal protein S18 acetylase RimI-like enzyme
MTSATAPPPPRRLRADDYPRIVALWQAAGLPFRPQGRDSHRAFEAQLAGGTQIVLGVEVAGELVGVVVATHDGRKGWLNRLAVHPDHRRRGIARQLIAASEAALREQGIHIIAALVEGDNPASLAVLKAAGYHEHEDIRYLSKRESAET